MTQTRFYRNRAFPEINYENDTLKTLNAMNYKNKFYLNNNNNLNTNFKKQNSTRAFSHLNFDLDKDYINNSNNYNYIPNSTNNSIINNTYNALSNKTLNNNLYKNNNKYNYKSNNSNVYRCKCTLRKGKSYNDITKLIDYNDKKENADINNNSLVRNYRTNNITDKKVVGNEISSNFNKTNNYNNIVYKTFNQINNSFNSNKVKYRNICDKCIKKHFYNESNGNFGNGFRNYNALRLCTTCKNLLNGENANKRNNKFLFA